MSFPELAVSRDGRRAILVKGLEPERPASDRDGFLVDARVQLRPRERTWFAQFFVSGPFQEMWDAPRQTLRWDEGFGDALPSLLMIALGDFMDSNEVPPLPSGNEYALKVPVTSELFSLLKPKKVNDSELGRFVEGRIYWAKKFNLGSAVFHPWEARRFGVEMDDLDLAPFPKIGKLWNARDGGGFEALPPLIDHFESGNVINPIPASVQQEYDVALSFAGEQRVFVKAVAESLRTAGVSVFYDDFSDLWGKDLPVELESVYRNQSRFIVVFVSKEYLEKAWPNLERQHALAGRMERMDNSVLPARFDDVELPGLPPTVGYLDLRGRTPESVAELVISKLGREGA